MASARSSRRARPLVAASTALALLAVVATSPTTDHATSDAELAEADAPPGARPSPRQPADIALDHLRRTHGSTDEARGLTEPSDTADLELRVDSTAGSEGVTHVYVQQQLGGIDIDGAGANVAVGDTGRVVYAPERLISTDGLDAQSQLDGSERKLDAVDAVTAALEHLGVDPTTPLASLGTALGDERLQYVTTGGVAVTPFRTRLMRVPAGKHLVLGWEVEIELHRGDHLRMIVAADDGRELRRDSYTIHHSYDRVGDTPDDDGNAIGTDIDEHLDDGPGDDEPSSAVETSLVADGSSYLVYDLPAESPMHGTATIVREPADPTASPFGWHDTDGTSGAESTLTTGNNVDAYLDTNGDDVADPGGRPDGGPGLDFTVPFSPTAAPDAGSNSTADVIQLFYVNNWAHDFFYAYGFDEAAGNFQLNNYGRGGSGGDPVRAETLDGYANAPDTSPPGVNRNNANFTTPPDGSPGRMQMYGFTLTSPDRSSALDAGVVIHEYAHGWSTRLTGGRYAVSCLRNAEQMGEGWSDFAALMATTRPGDDGADGRGIGNWVIGQGVEGGGIRQYPYSTDLGVDPRTYAWVPSASVPHGVGSIWAAMLWELNWALIDRHGFDPDLAHGSGGNNLAMQLVSDGLKLQPCSPGFVDGRDAILAADRIANGGANQCLIWQAFAKRGLGWSADQGSPGDATDGTAAFDLPADCPLEILITDAPVTANIGDSVTIEFSVSNRGGDVERDVTAVVESAGLAPRAGSLNCDHVATTGLTAARVTVGLAALSSDSTVRCSYDATVLDSSIAGTAILTADFEGGLGPFSATSASGSTSWTTNASFPRGGSSSAVATNPSGADETSDQFLVSPAMTVPRCSTLEFWHRHHTETSYDGGVIEVRVGAEPWTDLRPSIIDGEYPGRIATEYTNSAISGREAYSGLQWSYDRTLIDLDRHAGSDVQIRFRYVSDATVTSAGWWVDDVMLARPTGASIEATVSTTGSTTAHDCSVLDVTDATPAPAPPPTTSTPNRVEVDSSAGGATLAPASRLGPQD